MMIDSHAHIDYVPALGWDFSPEKVIQIMDKARIDKAVVSSISNLPGINPNALDYLKSAIDKYPDRLMAYVRLDPWYGSKAIEWMEKAINEYGFKGVKLHPVHYTLHPFQNSTINILKKAVDLEVPVLFHCSDEAMSLPLQISLAAEKVPDATIILAHMGGFFHNRDAINVAKRFPNVYVDTCEIPYPSVIRQAVEILGAEKVLFGTDSPGDVALLEIEKVKMANLKPEDEEKIFWKNISKILKLNS